MSEAKGMGINMKEEFLIQKYSKFGRVAPSGELYLPIKMCKELVQECSNNKVAVVGLELFHKRGEYIVPADPIGGIDSSSLLEKGSDWAEVVEKCNSFVLRVLNQEENKDNSLYCNLTLLEEVHWNDF